MNLVSEKQLNAINLLINSPDLTKRDVANKCDITEQTLYNWLKKDEFKTELEIQRRVFREKLEQFRYSRENALLDKAHTVLNDLLSSKDEKIKMKASQFTLKHFFYKNINDIDETKIKKEFKEDKKRLAKLDRFINYF